MSSKLPLHCLPLPPISHTLIHNLTPDPVTPDPATFHDRVLRTEPSVQRRTRLLDDTAHYSHVSPLPLEFPYRIEVDENSDRNKVVETWLSQKEALSEVDIGPSTLKAYSSDNRIKDYHIIGIAPRGLKDCVPALDIGDALQHIGIPSLVPNSDETKPGHLVDGNPPTANNTASENPNSPTRIREVLTDILSGHTALFDPSKGKGYAPWSLRYSGHQFGSWAGQLGDGRAISICQSIRP